jgi:hypothetical protein
MVFPSPAFQGFPAIILARVEPSGAAGTVQFMDGTTALGAPQPVFGGYAFLFTLRLAKGTHGLTAVFAPADPAAFGPSTSDNVPLEVRSLFDFLR